MIDDRTDPHRCIVGDCLDALRTLPENSIDACVCDPPYGLEFMGKEWDKLDGDAWRSGGGFSKPGIGERTTAWPAFGAGDAANASCAFCGGRMRGIRKCSCAYPDWRVKGKVLDRNENRKEQARSMQAWHERWASEVYRVLKPGAHLVAFGGTRTAHRLACAIEDAGFEIRDTIGWLQWQGFPKSMDVSKAIDAAAGAEREVVDRRRSAFGATDESESGDGRNLWGKPNGGVVDLTGGPVTPDAVLWSGWGTALKPAHEPAILARKPLDGTVAANVLKWGTGALNIDACRYPSGDPAWPGPQDEPEPGGGCDGEPSSKRRYSNNGSVNLAATPGSRGGSKAGRWPANVYACPKASRSEREVGCEGLPARSGAEAVDRKEGSDGLKSPRTGAGRSASAVRNHHPTVKALALMRWLVRLVTPPGGLVIDPFLGSGTTGVAAILEGVRVLGIEREPDYARIADARMAWAKREYEAQTAQSDLFRAPAERRGGSIQVALFGKDEP